MSTEPARYYTVTYGDDTRAFVEERPDTKLGPFDAASFESKELADQFRGMEEKYGPRNPPDFGSDDHKKIRRLLKAAETVEDQLWGYYHCRPALTPDSPR